MANSHLPYLHPDALGRASQRPSRSVGKHRPLYGKVYLDDDHLPESDGQPMSETDRHRIVAFDALSPLTEFFRDNPEVYVSGNIFVYYPDPEQAGKVRQISPDIFIVRGVPKHDRRTYRLNEEGKAPEVVIELTSTETKHIDHDLKPETYAYLGVKEYFLFDPFKETMNTCLRGFRLQEGAYVQMPDMPRLKSEVLGLELGVEEGELRLYDPKTGERLRTHKESEAERKAEKEGRLKAEAEAARLRKELAKLLKTKQKAKSNRGGKNRPQLRKQ